MQQDVNQQLKEQQQDLMAAIALEQQARRFALAGLETKLKSRSDELERVQQELATLTNTEGVTAGALVTAQNELTNITNEVKALRDTVREAQKDVDHQFDIVVKTTDEINQMRRVKADLENRQRPLQSAVAAMKSAMDKLGVRVDVEKDGTVRTDVDRVPPKVDGIVVNVGDKDLIEISIGDDDGILVGHELDVYRDDAYLGKVKDREDVTRPCGGGDHSGIQEEAQLGRVTVSQRNSASNRDDGVVQKQPLNVYTVMLVIAFCAISAGLPVALPGAQSVGEFPLVEAGRRAAATSFLHRRRTPWSCRT